MKFIGFLKIFAISFLSLIGAFAVGVGVMYVTGSFNEPIILPTSIAFELEEYNVDSDFVVKVTTSTPDVTINDIELTLLTTGDLEEKDGRISDGVISVPKTAKIGEEIVIKLEKTENEIDGLAWITGGHSTIRARSINLSTNEINTNCNSTQTKVNVDVPVHSIELITKSHAEGENTDKFVVNSEFNVQIKFTPERSAYQFSFDGKNGYQEKLKSTYFTLQSNNDTYVSQKNTSNVFNANAVGSSTILGYCFNTTTNENKFLELHKNLNETALRDVILAELKNGSENDLDKKTACSASKKIDIISVTVDKLISYGGISNVNLHETHTVYLNNSIEGLQSNASDLDITVSSTIDPTVYLQNEVNKVGIRFLLRDEDVFKDAVLDEDYIILDKTSYSQMIEIEKDGESLYYYLPVITDNIENYHWKFATNKELNGSIYVEIVFIENGEIKTIPVLKSFEPKKANSESISWNLTQAQKYVNLKIEDNVNEADISYEEYDLKPVIQVPANNQYKTTRYFAYTTAALKDEKTLDEFIYVKPAVVYVINGQEYKLYELTDGVVKSKTVNAHGITFEVMFVTVKNDHKGQLLYTEDGRYDIDQYSKDLSMFDNTISTIRFTVTKTLKKLVSHLEYNGANEDFIYNKEDESFAFVQGSINPFDVVVSYDNEYKEEEDLIFKTAIEREEIFIVVKTSDVVTDIIRTSSITSDTVSSRTFTRFTMTVGSLPLGNTSLNLYFYVRYYKTENRFIDIPVLLEFPDLNEYIQTQLKGEEPEPEPTPDPAPAPASTTVESYVAKYIEVYDGSAEVFKFNYNYLLEQEEKAVTSDANRILVTSDINSVGSGSVAYASSIRTRYSLNDETITMGLFAEKGGYQTSNVAIILLDKYGKKPISANYRLESSDTNIMISSGESFTFANNGTAELKLLNLETNEVEDILYFESKSSGSVSKVTVLNETVSNYESTKVNKEIFRDSDASPYQFEPITVSIYGYKGSTFYLKNVSTITNAEGEQEFLTHLIMYTYKYTYTGDIDGDPSTPDTSELREVNLVDLLKFEYVNPDDRTDLQGLLSEDSLNIETAGHISIERDFGQRKAIQIRAYVTELGISQIITLEIKPNVSISITQPSSVNAKSFAGVPFYTGVFAETSYKINVTLNYSVYEKDNRDNSTYSFFVYDGTDSTSVSKESNVAKILSDLTSFSNNENVNKKIFEVEIEFTSQNTSDGFQKLVLEFKKQENITNYDIQYSIYVYVNPNLKAKASEDVSVVYLKTKNLAGPSPVYGEYNIFGRKESETYPIVVERLEGVNEIDITKFTFKILTKNGKNNSDYYTSTSLIDDSYVLYCKKTLSNQEIINVNVLYNGYSVGIIELKISPNIRINPDSTNWVLYGENGGEYYLKLVRGNTTTTLESLKSSFICDTANITLNILPGSTSLISVVGGAVTVSENVTDKIYFYSENGDTEDDKFRIVVNLDNGSKLTFNVMLLPIDIPFMTYENVDTKTLNLSDLLLKTENIDWLKENGYYHTITETISVEDGGTPISFTAEDLQTEYGIQYIDYAVYRVDDEEHAYYYKNEEETFGRLSTNPVGQDTYVLLTANLSPISRDPLVIPYLIKICKELSIKVFYPYDMSANDPTVEVSTTDLTNSESTYIREYLSFDETGKVTIDLLETQSSDVPNKSPETSKRISMFKNENEYLDNAARGEIKFEVTKVYVSHVSGFMKINDISRYAVFTSGQNNGKLTIYSNGSEKVRLEIKVSSPNGLFAYYYVSVGEKFDNLQLKYNNSDVVDLDITANVERTDIIPNYSLLQIIASDNITNNLTHLLKFYTPSENLYIDEALKTITTDATTNNWSTKLLIYTKYGHLQSVNVNVESNYKVAALESEFESGCEIGIENFSAKKDGEDVADYSIISIELDQTSIDMEEYNKFFKVEDNKIIIGIVDEEKTLTYNIKFNLGKIVDPEAGEIDVIYNYYFKLKVKPVLKVASYDGDEIGVNNKYEIEVDDVADIKINLLDLFEYNGTQDFETWKNYVESNNIGEFTSEVVSEVALKNEYKSAITGTDVYVTVPDVVSLTTVSFKVEFKNFETNVIFVSYFVFTLNPVLTVTLNYPQASQNQSGSFNREYFYIGEPENKEKFNLSDEDNILSDKQRVVLSDDSKLDKILVSAASESGTTLITANSTAVTGAGTSQAKYPFDTDYTFTINSGVDDTITFTIYYEIIDSEDVSNYFAIETYTLVINNLISNVWNINAVNFNTPNTQNSSANYETIFIGSKDDIVQKIKVDISMHLQNGLKFENDTYLQITHLLGVSVSAKKVFVSEGSVTVEVYLENINLKQSEDIINNFYNLSYNLVDENDNNVGKDEDLIVTVTDVKTRISLFYVNEKCDIYKTFEIINSNEFSDSSITEYPITIYKGARYLNTYYAERIVDAKFDETTVELTTGESISVLANNNSIEMPNHKYLLNMKHISNYANYTFNDIVDNNIDFSIGNVSGNNSGYLRVTPLSRKHEDGSEYVYDYLFLAMGAPNESVTVVLEFIINVDDSAEKAIEITFIISNDYKNLTRKNKDLTDNTEINRNKITAMYDTMSDNSYLFATAGASIIGEDFLFIEHTNFIEGAVTGNIVPYFGISVDNKGQSYIQKLAQTDKNMNLVFMFRKSNFGNVNIDLTFRDEFGYTFNYYITLIAAYNPIYNSGTVTVFEDESVYVTELSDDDTASKLIRVKFEKDSEMRPDITATSDDVTISGLSYKFIVDEVETTLEYDIVNDIIKVNGEDKTELYGKLLTLLERDEKGRYGIYINLLPDEFYEDNATQIKGKLNITFLFDGVENDIDVDLIIKQRYTIKTVDETVYVRDNVEFSLIDVIEVIDNKNSVSVGSKKLTNEDSVYIKYELTKNGSPDKFSIGNIPVDGTDFSMSLGIKAYNKNSGKSTTMAISDVEDMEAYTSLHELFGITSISNLEFRLVVWDPNGQIVEVSKDSTPYIIKINENSGVSTEIVFYGYYESGKNADTIVKYAIGGKSQINENGKTYIINESYYYKFKITESSIIKDQILTIGLREILNYKSSNITIYFQNGQNGYKPLVINCDESTERKISLCEAGIITSGKYTDFYTGVVSGTDVLNGMTDEDRAKLKDIQFTLLYVGPNPEDPSLIGKTKEENITKTSTKLTDLDIDPLTNQHKFDVINETNIYYQQQILCLDVNYGKILEGDDIKYQKVATLNLPIKVTLMFISLNKNLAYGSGQVRYVNADKVSGSTSITLENWAGTNENKPFVMVTGQTAATAYLSTGESIFLSDNAGESGNVRFSINSTESGAISNFASINATTGLITLDPEFDFSNNYISIDIQILYAETKLKRIDTVKVAVYNPEINNIQKNNNKVFVSKVGENYLLEKEDLYKLVSIIDGNGNVWTGNDLSLFATVEGLTLNMTVDHTTKSFFGSDSSFTFANKPAITISYIYSDVDPTTGEESTISGEFEFKTSDVTLYRYTPNCMLSNNIEEFNFTTTDKETILNTILDNVQFVDIFGNPTTIDDFTTGSEGYVYSIMKDGSEIAGDLSGNTSYSVVFKYIGDETVIMGSVLVNIYNVNSLTSTIESKAGESFEVFKAFDNISYYGYSTKTEESKTIYYISIPNTYGFDTINDKYSVRGIEYGGEGSGTVRIDENTIIITITEYFDDLKDLEFIKLSGFKGEDALEINVGFIKQKDYTPKIYNDIYSLISEYFDVELKELQVRIYSGDQYVNTFVSDVNKKWTISLANNAQHTIIIQIYRPIAQIGTSVDTDIDALNLVYFELSIVIPEEE